MSVPVGYKQTDEHKKNISLALMGHRPYCSMEGETNPKWKGNYVKYRGLHMWVQRHKGKACCCENCGIAEIPEGRKRYFQWANLSKEYKRDITDYISLCVSCHKNYDLGNIKL